MALHILFYIWAIINFGAGLWEIYAFQNRYSLHLEKRTLWEKISAGQIDIRNFWIEGWSEYCKVDSRYIPTPQTSANYVWFFELLNAFLAPLFIIALLTKNYVILKLILAISIFNCLGYFATLLMESIHCSRHLQNAAQYAQWWMFPIYYLISGIWLIVPWILYIQLQ